MHQRTRHTVLVVDDHAATRYATVRSLQVAGYGTIEAPNGGEALARAGEAAAMVLDVQLPDIDGFEVCRRVREQERGTLLPIVQVSGVYMRRDDQARGEASGADVYLVHPVDPDLLVKLLDNLIVASRLQP